MVTVYTAPVDITRCQAMVPTAGPFALGGPVGDPRDGYRRRCDNTPDRILVENTPGSDGKVGRMALCQECVAVYEKQVGFGGTHLERIGWHMWPEAYAKAVVERTQEQLDPEVAWGSYLHVSACYEKAVVSHKLWRLILFVMSSKHNRRPWRNTRLDYEVLVKTMEQNRTYRCRR